MSSTAEVPVDHGPGAPHPSTVIREAPELRLLRGVDADESDVHRSRVRDRANTDVDIHDRVNHAVTHSFLRVDASAATITLELDTEASGLLEYFEIFLDRMILCRRAARTLGSEFRIVANDTELG